MGPNLYSLYTVWNLSMFLCRPDSSEYHYNILQTKGYSTMSRIFLITKESQDEQRPILVPAHPASKFRQKLPFMENLIP